MDTSCRSCCLVSVGALAYSLCHTWPRLHPTYLFYLRTRVCTYLLAYSTQREKKREGRERVSEADSGSHAEAIQLLADSRLQYLFWCTGMDLPSSTIHFIAPQSLHPQKRVYMYLHADWSMGWVRFRGHPPSGNVGYRRNAVDRRRRRRGWGDLRNRTCWWFHSAGGLLP